MSYIGKLREEYKDRKFNIVPCPARSVSIDELVDFSLKTGQFLNCELLDNVVDNKKLFLYKLPSGEKVAVSVIEEREVELYPIRKSADDAEPVKTVIRESIEKVVMYLEAIEEVKPHTPCQCDKCKSRLEDEGIKPYAAGRPYKPLEGWVVNDDEISIPLNTGDLANTLVDLISKKLSSMTKFSSGNL